MERLSDLADAINENYWGLDDPNGFDVVNRAILDYAERTFTGSMPYTFGDEEVSPLEFISALAELVRYKQEVNS